MARYSTSGLETLWKRTGHLCFYIPVFSYCYVYILSDYTSWFNNRCQFISCLKTWEAEQRINWVSYQKNWNPLHWVSIWLHTALPGHILKTMPIWMSCALWAFNFLWSERLWAPGSHYSPTFFSLFSIYATETNTQYCFNIKKI